MIRVGNTCVMRFKTLITKGIRSRVNGFERIGARLRRGGIGGVSGCLQEKRCGGEAVLDGATGAFRWAQEDRLCGGAAMGYGSARGG